MPTTRLDVEGMTCANCVRHVQHAIEGVAGVDAVQVSLATDTATIDSAEPLSAARLRTVRRAVQDAGYRLVDPGGEARDEAARRWRGFVFAAVWTAPLFAYMMVWLPLGGASLSGDAWLVFALATPVQFVAGWTFYRGTWIALRNRDATMDTLIALGSSAAYGLSVYEVARGAGVHATYFETSAVIITLILLGKYLEARAKNASQQAVRSLLDLGAKTATRIDPGGAEETVLVDSLQSGDLVLVRPGETIPADGTVESGRADVDTSMLTGEPIPRTTEAGDGATGGTIVRSGSLRVRLTAVGKQTTLAQIARLVADANARQAPLQRVADQVSRYFVPAVLLLATAAGLYWSLDGAARFGAPDGMDAIRFGILSAVTVLVIACPCAMGLATPTAIMVGTGLGARQGILIKGGDALQRVRAVDTVVLDKTGTITEGRPRVTKWEPFGKLDQDFVVALAAAAESDSEHPIARAIQAHASDHGIAIPVARSFRSEPGRGVAATVDGADVVVGTPAWLATHGIETEQAGLLVAVDGRVEARVHIADAPRATSRSAIEHWKAAGLEVVLLTGDERGNAEAVAAAVGIGHEQVYAEVLPADKEAHVRRLQAEGRIVAMVGDGINDAPALAAADVGIAIGSGTDIAKETGDIVLVDGDLGKAVDAMRLSAFTVRKIKQNLGWALGYNAALIPLAMGVLYPSTGWLLSPMLAAGAMALSSVSVIGNSLSMKRWSPQAGASLARAAT